MRLRLAYCRARSLVAQRRNFADAERPQRHGKPTTAENQLGSRKVLGYLKKRRTFDRSTLSRIGSANPLRSISGLIFPFTGCSGPTNLPGSTLRSGRYRGRHRTTWYAGGSLALPADAISGGTEVNALARAQPLIETGRVRFPESGVLRLGFTARHGTPHHTTRAGRVGGRRFRGAADTSSHRHVVRGNRRGVYRAPATFVPSWQRKFAHSARKVSALLRD